MAANGTTQTSEEATVNVCDLDMLVQAFFLKESPAVLSLGNLCEETVNRMNGIQVSHQISSKMGEHRV